MGRTKVRQDSVMHDETYTSNQKQRMRVATFQPTREHLNPVYGRGGKRSKLEEMYQSDIMWVIPANDKEELFINSLLTVPVCPEMLIVMDVAAGAIGAIDKIAWDAYLNGTIPFEAVEIKKGVDIPIEERYKYEFFILPNGIETVYACLNIEEAVLSFKNNLSDDDLAFVNRKREVNIQLAEGYAKRRGDKTFDDYFNERQGFSYRNIYISYGQMIWDYSQIIEQGRLGVPTRSLPLTFADEFYTFEYSSYSFKPTTEELKRLHSYLMDMYKLFYVK